MLTRKQHELLLFIHERLKETGIPPSFDEMKEALDLASKSGIHRLITALEERGFIRRLPNRARALEVLRLPDSIAPGLNAQKKFAPSVIEGSLGKAPPPPFPGSPCPCSYQWRHVGHGIRTGHGTNSCGCADLRHSESDPLPQSPAGNDRRGRALRA